MHNQHKVFISYYHTEDQSYRDHFEELFLNFYGIVVTDSIRMGDFDDKKVSAERIRQYIRDKYLRDTTVTVVLVGANTWQQKSVDWEISSSLHQTQYTTRSGLLGILLPTYQRLSYNSIDSHRIPPRLMDNIACGFSKLYVWDENPYTVQSWIHYAYKRRTEILPDFSRDPYKDSQ